jgi:hypothetical protein
VPWWRFQHFFRIFSPRSQDFVAVTAGNFARIDLVARSRHSGSGALDRRHRCLVSIVSNHGAVRAN